MKKIKKQRGFTLVELIVVLVILAVLAALLVPALTGYIDKAKKSQVIAETRMLVQAVQTETSELYAQPEWSTLGTFSPIAEKVHSANEPLSKVDTYNEIVSLAEVPSLQNGGKGRFCGYVSQKGRVAFLMYWDGSSHIGIYFAETGEYIAMTPDEAPYYETFLSAMGDRVCVNGHFNNINSPVAPFTKELILASITGK